MVSGVALTIAYGRRNVNESGDRFLHFRGKIPAVRLCFLFIRNYKIFEKDKTEREVHAPYHQKGEIHPTNNRKRKEYNHENAEENDLLDRIRFAAECAVRLRR